MDALRGWHLFLSQTWGIVYAVLLLDRNKYANSSVSPGPRWTKSYLQAVAGQEAVFLH